MLNHTLSSKEQLCIYASHVLRRNESGSFVPKIETLVTALTCAEEARLNNSATTGGTGTERAPHILEIR